MRSGGGRAAEPEDSEEDAEEFTEVDEDGGGEETYDENDTRVSEGEEPE